VDKERELEDNTYRLVLVGNDTGRLIGLREIFEELKNQKERPASQLKEMLVEKIATKKLCSPLCEGGILQRLSLGSLRNS